MSKKPEDNPSLAGNPQPFLGASPQGSRNQSHNNPNPVSSPSGSLGKGATSPLVVVETAFLASAASLIWLINTFFPLGPLLRIFFPVPIALVYMRWGNRAAWMATLVSGLLLTVLMGPTRSVLFIMPFGFLGVLLGYFWRRGANWLISISLGSILGTAGLFFRFWLLSILAGDDLWRYVTTQIRGWLEWVFLKLGFLSQPDLGLVQLAAVGLIIVNSVIYLFVVHVAAWWLLERLGNPIPDPPEWVQTLLEEE
jgi:uncharacterized protein YybS (DUF2232 family)